MDKRRLRGNLKTVRNGVKDRTVKDGEIRRRLFELLLEKYPKRKTLFTYVSFGGEADTRALIERASGLYELYYPYTDFSEERLIPMIPKRAAVFKNLMPDRYGNLSRECYSPEKDRVLSGDYGPFDIPAVTVAPLLGFNRDNHRIGYGKGCYDRYFAAAPDTVKIGLAYDEQECDFTADKTDIALDYVVTPTTIYEKGKNIRF